MPEIKNQFTGGKMNKDLDERLVKNGEYRDAMNIEVSTSEGSNVGTIQNILGNQLLSSGTAPWGGSGAVCVGSIADEKNDVAYWFVYTLTDNFIFRYDLKPGNATGLKIVFADINNDTLNFTNQTITGINIIDGMLFWTDNNTEPKKINIERSILGTPQNGVNHTKLINSELNINLSDNIDVEEKHITVIKKGPSNPLKLEFLTGRVEGVKYSGVVSVTQDPGFNENVSSLANFPDNPVGAFDFTGLNIGDTISVWINTDIDGNPDFTLDGWLDSGNIINGLEVVLKEYDDDGAGAIQNIQPAVPINPTNYRIKGNIVNWSYNSVTQDSTQPNFYIPGVQGSSSWPPYYLNRACVKIKINSINGYPPTPEGQAFGSSLQYVIDRFDDIEKLFEFKFPRFSYRYKYEDGEYSTFAPWSRIAFEPGNFDHHPKKGYNLGMTNIINQITMSGFVPADMPLDVVSVDILYKEDTSPQIYLVQSFANKDDAGGSVNEWNKNSYIITSETIKSVLPSNQFLRPWDNVPRKALAQDITGNRIVYGNYLQNYNLTVGNYVDNYSPDFIFKVEQNTHTIPKAIRSIKSLREYQLGVVFVDQYGRETPVVSNSSGTLKLSKDYAVSNNHFTAEFNQGFPISMSHMKFYIKETSGEYYNMALDRYYDADDGNVWLAFPSSDRNKIDIDTFLILKKGNTSDGIVPEKGRYKILAIESEAPDFIKTVQLKIAEETHVLTGTVTQDIFGPDMEYAPQVGYDQFKIAYAPFHSSAAANLHEILDRTSDKLYIEFALQTEDGVSNRYQVSEISCDYDARINPNTGFQTIPLADAFYYIRIKGVFDDDVNFISDDSTGFASTEIIDTAQIRFYKYSVENRPEFDGRFFAKIYRDGTFSTHVKKLYDVTKAEYKTTAKRNIYLLDEDMHSADFIGGAIQLFHPGGYVDGTVGGINVNAAGDDMPWSHNVTDYAMNGMYLSANINAEIAESGSGPYGFAAYYKGDNNVQSYLPATVGDETEVGFGALYMNKGMWRKAQFFAWFTPFSWEAPKLRQYFSDNGYLSNYLTSLAYHNLTTNRVGQGALHPTSPPNFNGFYEYTGYTRFPSNNSKAPDFEECDTWFVDKGRYVCHNHNSGDDLAIDGHWGRSSTDANRSYGLHSSGTKLDLGFGPIYGDFGPRSDQGDVDRTAYFPMINFFNIGDNTVEYDHQKSFSTKINPGFQFRFKLDPTQTIYTIQANIDIRNKINYYHKDAYGLAEPSTGNAGDFLRNTADQDFRATPDEGHAANYSKRFRMTIDPPMDSNSWNPISTPLEPIQNGIKITLPLSTSSSATPVGVYTWSTLDGFYISLDTLVGVDENDSNKPRSIYPGMILTSYVYNGGGDVQVFEGASGTNHQYLLIDDIEYVLGTQTYKLYLVGYQWPLRIMDIPGDASGDLADEPFFPGGNIVFEQPSMNMVSPMLSRNVNRTSNVLNDGYAERNMLGAVGYAMEFVEPINPIEVVPDYPAIFETEPKEYADLNIYYEVGGKLPLILNQDTVATAIPIDSTLNKPSGMPLWIEMRTVVSYDIDPAFAGTSLDGRSVLLDDMTGVPNQQWNSFTAPSIVVTKPDGTTIKLKIASIRDIDPSNPGAAQFITFFPDLYENVEYGLPYYNCYSFANGVESNRIRDNFNQPFISNGVKASTTLGEEYHEEHRKSGLIYSGIYNSISGTNNLNQFIQAEKITKDVNPVYGSIQKLHSRDSDLVALCEDKILKILANKDAVFNADGNPQLIATPNVLGQVVPFAGEYGISKDPASFASESYRAYFTDRQRGAVLRLSRDGLTPISDYGMKDWFKDHLKIKMAPGSTPYPAAIIGNFDTRNNDYNLKINGRNDGPAKHPTYVLSFSEDVKGWTSFKSFVEMESGISLSGGYYTFRAKDLYKHYSETTDRNTFYDNHAESSFKVLLNESPGVIKSFKTLNYEGSQSKVKKFIEYTLDGSDNSPVNSGQIYTDLDFHNFEDKKGWYVEKINTDMQDGKMPEFINKENKWFNYIKGIDVSTNGAGNIVSSGVSSLDESEFSFQGLGRVLSTNINIALYGCTDPSFSNFDPNANIDDGSCDGALVPGCTLQTAVNYDPLATYNDGSCITVGCTIYNSFNYDPSASIDDGSCIPFRYGCISNQAPLITGEQNTVDGVIGNWVLSYGTPSIRGMCADRSQQNAPGNINFSGTWQMTTNNYPAPTWDYAANGNFIGHGLSQSQLEVDALPGYPFHQYGYPEEGMPTAGLNWALPSPYQALNLPEASLQNVQKPLPILPYNEVDHFPIAWPLLANKTEHPFPNTHNSQGCVFIQYGIIAMVPSSNPSINAAMIEQLGQHRGPAIGYEHVNHDEAANVNQVSATNTDSPCIEMIFGCTYPGAANYDPAASAPMPEHARVMNYPNTQDPICIINGCTDSTAINYDMYATFDDGTCCSQSGCQTVGMIEYDALNCLPCYDDNGIANGTGGNCCTPCVYGCTDPNTTASNYDPLATCDDGSCVYPEGCIDPIAFNYADWQGNGLFGMIDDGSCVVPGCIDDGNMGQAWWNNSQYTNPTGPANQLGNTAYELGGGNGAYTDYSLLVVKNAFQSSITAGTYANAGWANGPGAGNSTNTVENIDYWDAIDQGIIGWNNEPVGDVPWTPVILNGCEYDYIGCMDSLAPNYNSAATIPCPQDDGVTSGNYTSSSINGCCENPVPGCTDDPATSSNQKFTNGVADGFGAWNYNLSATINVGCCYHQGCMDVTADNYSILNCIDDGSCVFFNTAGCSDQTQGYWPNTDGNDSILQDPCVDPTDLGLDQSIEAGPYWSGGCADSNGNKIGYFATNYDPLSNTGNLQNCDYIYGCGINGHVNFSPYHKHDGGDGANPGPTGIVDPNGSCAPVVYGCLHEEFTDLGTGVVYYNFNHGSGEIGAPFNVRGWSPYAVVPTGDFTYDVNTHDQTVCIGYDDQTAPPVANQANATAGCTQNQNGDFLNNGQIFYQHYIGGATYDYATGTNGPGPYNLTTTPAVEFKQYAANGSLVANSFPFNYNETWGYSAGVADGSIQNFETSIDEFSGGFEFDPVNPNACCNHGGCIHPFALNYDAKGFIPNTNSNLTQIERYQNPVYVGIGVQTGTSSTVNYDAGGKACVACPGDWLMYNGVDVGEGTANYNDGNFSRFYEVFYDTDNKIKSRIRQGGVAGTDSNGNTQVYELTYDNYIGFSDTGWNTTDWNNSVPGAGVAVEDRNPWNYQHPAHQCCAFDNQPYLPGNAGSPVSIPGCTSPNACPSGWPNNEFSPYNPAANWDNGTCCMQSDCNQCGQIIINSL